jgi:hypothetical protein
MIKIENQYIVGWEHAIRGARNPFNSWHRLDSTFEGDSVKLGPNDYKLLTKLANAGSDHGKFMRMIVVYIDITAPLYWWKEFDTYKVGTVSNSCSTMHKIHDKEFVADDFSHERLSLDSYSVLLGHIKRLNTLRTYYLVSKEKPYWDEMIQMLPSSYNQRRTIMLNYEVLKNMYHARKNHKLYEWVDFCRWIETLPYSELITGGRNE